MAFCRQAGGQNTQVPLRVKETARSYTNRGETIEKPQDTATLLSRHFLDKPGKILNSVAKQ